MSKQQEIVYRHSVPVRVKYVMRIEAVDDIAGMSGGRGGFWEDLGYEWYAGI